MRPAAVRVPKAQPTVTRLRVGVIYGGRSGEHEVSLASAASVIAHLDPRRYDVVPILIGRDGRWALPASPPTQVVAAAVIGQARLAATGPSAAPPEVREVLPLARPGRDTLLTLEGQGAAAPLALGLDVVFPVLHGPFGEDGTVQGLLELAGVPYVGAGVLASAVGMDKAVMKVLFRSHGLAVSDWVVVRAGEWRARRAAVVAEVAERLTLPVFVKPANAGSSVGISKVKTWDRLEAAIDLAATFDVKIVVEQAVPRAREIEVAVLGNDAPEASVPGEIVPAGEFYDYEAKYLNEGSALYIPAPLDEATTAEIRRQALVAYQAVEGAGMARVDFLVDRETGGIFLNEVNTIPGFTTISMYPKLWAASGLAYPALLDRLIALALDRHGARQALRTSAQ